jgi:exodeoxyribonuclease V alpha subunit
MTVPAPLLDDTTATLAPFVAAGVLDAAAVHVAATVTRATGESDPDVVLAAALAARAPTHGHVCVIPEQVAATIVVDTVDDRAPLDMLPWPDPVVWADGLAASPAVRAADQRDAGVLRPLVWDGRRLYLERYWRHEATVAADLLRRAASPGAVGAPPAEVARVLDRWFGARDPDAPDAPDAQRRAAEIALGHGLAVVAGGPGTGKTRTVARLLGAAHEVTAARHRPLDVALAAPTGKAAARMTEAVHEEIAATGVSGAVAAQLAAAEASTLHRLLGWVGGTEYRRDARHPLPHDLVVVDETSMASLPLMARLVAAVRPDATLVLVGDPHQLASVEAGAVLGEIVGPEPGAATAGIVRERIVVLERAHRFAPDSSIAALAGAIRVGDTDRALSLLRTGGDELRWVADDDTAGIAALEQTVCDHAAAVLADARAGNAAAGLERAAALKVLCATRHGLLGSYRWNDRVESSLAHAVPGAALYRRFYAGRPLIVTRNDYPHRLANGDVGLVVARENRTVAVFRDGAEVRELATSQLDEVETWWAMTIHKSQGSEFPEVIVTLPPEPSPILTRELLYTAVTRARERVTVVASEAALRTAITHPVARSSGLAARLHAAGERGVGHPIGMTTGERADGVMTLPGLG